MRPSPIEQALTSHLAALLGVTVATVVPNRRPARFVIVQRIGGNRRNLVQSRPLMVVQAWATTRTEAWDLACDAYEALDELPYSDDSLPPGAWVADVDLSDPINLPDSASGTPRYQFTAAITTSLED